MDREKVQRTGHHGEVHALNRSKNVNGSIIWPMLKQVPKKCPVTFDTLRERGKMSDETSQKKLRISKTIQERIIIGGERPSSTFSPVLHMNIETFKSYKEIKYK